jgi:hypothetical protein
MLFKYESLFPTLTLASCANLACLPAPLYRTVGAKIAVQRFPLAGQRLGNQLASQPQAFAAFYILRLKCGDYRDVLAISHMKEDTCPPAIAYSLLVPYKPLHCCAVNQISSVPLLSSSHPDRIHHSIRFYRRLSLNSAPTVSYHVRKSLPLLFYPRRKASNLRPQLTSPATPTPFQAQKAG